MEEAGESGDVIVRAEKQKSAVNLREKIISVSRRCLHYGDGTTANCQTVLMNTGSAMNIL